MCSSELDERQFEVGIDRGVAVPREVLAAGGHPVALQLVDDGGAEPGHHRGVVRQGPIADDGVLRVGVDVEHRRVVQRDAHRPQLGGVILFARNIEAPEQVAELAYDAQQLVPAVPLWVSVDQEGGRVARLKAPFTEWPPMATLGRRGDDALARRFAAALAAELRAVGVTLDYAPVLDIHTNPKNPIIGDRALSDRKSVV